MVSIRSQTRSRRGPHLSDGKRAAADRKGCRKALESYVKIVVNGKAIYPKSIEKALVGKLTCNGAMTVYPDDAIFVEKELIADKVFAARAQENTAYYTDRKAYLLDADAVEKLAESIFGF